MIQNLNRRGGRRPNVLFSRDADHNIWDSQRLSPIMIAGVEGHVQVQESEPYTGGAWGFSPPHGSVKSLVSGEFSGPNR
jgi:hypothetical protein